MKKIITCFVVTVASQKTVAQPTCIPSVFADQDIEASYEKMTKEKTAELAALQKEYADFANQVQTKKGRDNKIELANAFIDAAGAAYIIHTGIKIVEYKTIGDVVFPGFYKALTADEIGELGDPQKFRQALRKHIQGLDENKKSILRKQLGKNYENKIIKRFAGFEELEQGFEKFTDNMDDLGTKSAIGTLIKEKINIPKRLKNWFKELKDLPLGDKAKNIISTSAKKVGFSSMILMGPLFIYIVVARTNEQQRLVQLSAEQDKVVKQALVLEMLLAQKSFANLAATRARLQPNKVCPPA